MTSSAINWSPFDPSNTIGDPGRQRQIQATSGPLGVGVPDTALDFLSIGPFEVRACATRGWSHRYLGTPRQDWYSILANDDLVVVAVADGVSEGEHSQVAAETAARSACKLVAQEVAKNGGVDWLQLSRRISVRIIDEAEYRQISGPVGASPTIEERLAACLRTMATTLIVAVLRRTPRPEGFPVEIAVVAGDSAAYLLHADASRLTPAGGGKTADGPITSTGVRPLPGPVEPTVQEFMLRPGEMLAVGSDGIGDPVGDGDGEVGRELASRWRQPPTIDQFLVDVNFFRRSYDDDRTCVSVWVRPDVELPEPPASAESADAPEEPAASDAPEEPAASDAPEEPAPSDAPVDRTAEDGPAPVVGESQEHSDVPAIGPSAGTAALTGRSADPAADDRDEPTQSSRRG